MRVLLAGGGSAGHTSPLIATADALVRLDPATEVTCLGTARGLETRVVPEAGYPLELIPPVPMPRRPGADLLKVPSRLRAAVRETHAVIDRVRPEVVVGFGGYVSVPAYLACRKRGLPVVVHEQNALPGLGNKVGARIARRVAVSFPDTPLKDAEYVGLPLRRMISTLDRAALRAEARAHFGLDPDRPTLLVTGGSQGARHLNQAVSAAAPALAEAGAQVLHVQGKHGGAEPAPTGVPYVVLDYVDRMDLALAAADLAVCRAGANSVVEAAATGLPAVLVPLPIGNGEQELNARPVVDAGGALLVADAELTVDWVTDHVPALLGDPARLEAMSAAAQALVPRDADDRLARIVVEASQ
ncbi:MAG TPA: undecaprenyldiphospho-muramoylpentapeptide beta-N-acetylglucosaminyltransferase [Nocardioides sp.]|nr:undecaprenyldiphospho-muramoylpentapeptide beta-N-acetylglucosaminyltransferase [Nocardioides sp.]